MAKERGEKFQKGLKVRREVLGADYVDSSVANATALTEDLQTYVTEACWNDIWNRPGLERKQRSLLNIGMLVALGRIHELKLHLKGALNNGMTRDEIKECMLQACAYCGFPAGIEGFRAAAEVFAEIDKKTK